MTRFTFRGALGAAALIALSTPVAAHVTLERTTAAPNATYRAVLQVNHGCRGAATTGIKVTVPEGIIAARPMPKPGWSVSTVRGPYAKPYRLYGEDLTEGVKEIAWSGASLPDDQYDEFVFVARVTDAVAPGSTVYFPVVQDCVMASSRWVEVPEPGRTSRDLKSPAPGVTIAGAADAMAGMHDMSTMAAASPPAAAAAVKAGDLVIASPWMRATPGGAKVAGGYVRVTNTGSEPDRLVGTSIPLAGRGEVHQMSMTDGIMRMSPVEGGLEIKPGQSVELKPGGYHLMFMDLREAAKAGDTVRGTLVFQRAGTVEVTFRVEGMGVQGPSTEQPHH